MILINSWKPELSGRLSAFTMPHMRNNPLPFDSLWTLNSISVLAQANPISSLLVVQAYMRHANWLIFEIEFRVSSGFGFPRIQKCIKSIVFWVGIFQQTNISTRFTAHCYHWLQFIYKWASLHAYNIPVF